MGFFSCDSWIQLVGTSDRDRRTGGGGTRGEARAGANDPKGGEDGGGAPGGI